MAILFTDFVDMCNQTATQIAQLTAQVNDLTNQLTAANADKAGIQQQLDAVQLQVTQLNQSLNAATAQIQTLQSANAGLSNQILTLQTANTQLTQQVAALQAQLNTVSNKAAVDAAMIDVVTGRRAMTVLAGLHKLPADTTTNKEQLGVWIDSGGHTAQSNPGTNTTPHGTFTWTPGTDTTPARIVFTPAAGWDNIFEYERFALPADLPTYVVDIRTFSMSVADRTVANAVEFQQQFTWNQKTYNLAWQWNLGTKLFRYFDHAHQTWKPSVVPFVDLGTAPVTLMAEYILDKNAGTATHLAFSVNGVRTILNVTQAATATAGAANKYTISINQLDSDSKGDPFGLNIHNCEARYLV